MRIRIRVGLELVRLGTGIVLVGGCQWLNWFCEAGGLTWRSQVGANPIPIPTPLIWRYLGIKWHFIDSIRGGGGLIASYYCRGGSNGSRGGPLLVPPLTLTTEDVITILRYRRRYVLYWVTVSVTVIDYYVPPLIVGGIKRWFCLTSCLSVSLSRTSYSFVFWVLAYTAH